MIKLWMPKWNRFSYIIYDKIWNFKVQQFVQTLCMRKTNSKVKLFFVHYVSKNSISQSELIFHKLCLRENVFINYAWENLVWRPCLRTFFGTLSGVLVWGRCLGTLFGDLVWGSCLGTLLGDLVWVPRLGTLFGVLFGDLVWGPYLGPLLLPRQARVASSSVVLFMGPFGEWIQNWGRRRCDQTGWFGQNRRWVRILGTGRLGSPAVTAPGARATHTPSPNSLNQVGEIIEVSWGNLDNSRNSRIHSCIDEIYEYSAIAHC